MSIVTRTGDQGTTALMYGRRVPKNHPRCEAYGTVDELNACIGLARSITAKTFLRENLVLIQKELIILMGELAIDTQDRERYERDGFKLVSPEMVAFLDQLVAGIEKQNISFKGWATPGNTATAAALDVARTVCRRAERRVFELGEEVRLLNPQVLIYLNRLADLLWLMARWEESQHENSNSTGAF